MIRFTVAISEDTNRLRKGLLVRNRWKNMVVFVQSFSTASQSGSSELGAPFQRCSRCAESGFSMNSDCQRIASRFQLSKRFSPWRQQTGSGLPARFPCGQRPKLTGPPSDSRKSVEKTRPPHGEVGTTPEQYVRSFATGHRLTRKHVGGSQTSYDPVVFD